MSQLTTHILDTTSGTPAADVEVSLFKRAGEDWGQVCSAKTNSDGRIPDLLEKDVKLNGLYKLRFETGKYFRRLSAKTFYPYIEITFEVLTDEHYHVPLLLNPFGYSTYRGS
jgi:5-hydroxyisourate hydrolase